MASTTAVSARAPIHPTAPQQTTVNTAKCSQNLCSLLYCSKPACHLKHAACMKHTDCMQCHAPYSPRAPLSLICKAQPPLDLGPVTPPPGLQSFFVCGPAALVGCSTGSFWYKLLIHGGLFANFHLGRLWCSIHKPNSQKKYVLVYLYNTKNQYILAYLYNTMADRDETARRAHRRSIVYTKRAYLGP